MADGQIVNFNPLKTYPLSQKAVGFLYGLSEPNIPTVDLLKGINPKFIVQKVVDGLQHPTGDGVRLESMADAIGVEHIQIYLQDMYLEWPYETKGTLDETLDDYYDRVLKKLEKMQCITGDNALKKYNFILFNEPDYIWFIDDAARYFSAWKQLYKRVKALNPEIKCAGPAAANYSKEWVLDYLDYCHENNCLPDIIVWHELFDGADAGNSLVSFHEHWRQIQKKIKEYYIDRGLEKPIAVVNEYALFEDMGAGGALLPWLAMFEEAGIYACSAYWGLANTANELAADANIPNSAWWLYKWYNDLTGERMDVSTENNKAAGNYGIGSIDEDNETVYVIFGGQSGVQTAYINGLGDTKAFGGAKGVHVKLYSTSYSGQHGEYIRPYLEFEGNLPLVDGNLKLQVKDCNDLDVYYAIIHPETCQETISIESFNKVWTATYEAEDAVTLGKAKKIYYSKTTDLARSNRGEVGNILDTDDGVEFTVHVPEDGRYELKVYYSVPAPAVNPLTLEIDAKGQNRAIGQLVKHELLVDGKHERVLTYSSTVKLGYVNYTRTYIDLTKGQHKLCLMHYGENQSHKDENIRLTAALDKIELSYKAEMGNEIQIPEIKIEAEEVIRNNKNFKFNNEIPEFSGAGYVEGQGDFTFTVVAPEDGLYDVQILGYASSHILIKRQIVDYGKDAKSTSGISIRNITLGVANDGLAIYLTKGANTITLSCENQLILDAIIFRYNDLYTRKNSKIIEAEDAVLSGSAKIILNEYASGGKMVDGLTGSDSKLAFDVEVDKAGHYALSLFFSNNEPAPVMPRISKEGLYVHPYNTDLIERYAQIVINDNEPQTVYFRNTLSWDMIKNVVMVIKLQAGKNRVVIYNDNSYQFSELVKSSAPRFDKFAITPASVNL
ncbi:MAG: hypothetical protein GX160_02895 [Clostridiales bacterium]|nr:hypothetical protein [Clostridiales bacterium]